MNLGSHSQSQFILSLSAHGNHSFDALSSYIILSSPDLNALDLGAWYSLAAGVPSLKAVPNQKMRTFDQIISHVLARWRTWDAFTRLENIFATKQRVIQAVFDSDGSNEYQIPRSFRSHHHEKASYLPEPKTPPLLLDTDCPGTVESNYTSNLQGTPPLLLNSEWDRNSQAFDQENDVLSYWSKRISGI